MINYLLLFCFGVLLSYLYILHPFTLDQFHTFTESFQAIALGIAALLTAYFGSSYFLDERTRQKQIDLYRKNYPPDKYGNTWEIVVREDRTGEPHVLDIATSVRHHIWNMKTIYDLGWQFYKREPVAIEKFNSYHPGEKIKTRGDLNE